ncbi:hypothetical protein DFH08DRAFT_457191 [Mycena albidolilacea]|uniref:Uncharacterized protein n=1 Tax=Mycena albidolilacea TaxID=1033008 RepID=A0AAD6Z7H2_9AGAR|nr:hypothetical protein DFH08DRAFT_457191 [Mycena albidolilacea]
MHASLLDTNTQLVPRIVSDLLLLCMYISAHHLFLAFILILSCATSRPPSSRLCRPTRRATSLVVFFNTYALRSVPFTLTWPVSSSRLASFRLAMSRIVFRSVPCF